MDPTANAVKQEPGTPALVQVGGKGRLGSCVGLSMIRGKYDLLKVDPSADAAKQELGGSAQVQVGREGAWGQGACVAQDQRSVPPRLFCFAVHLQTGIRCEWSPLRWMAMLQLSM